MSRFYDWFCEGYRRSSRHLTKSGIFNFVVRGTRHKTLFSIANFKVESGNAAAYDRTKLAGAYVFFKPTHVYVKIRKNTVWAKHLEKQTRIEQVSPEPFTTTRLLVGQVTVAAAVVKSAIRQSYANQRLVVSPNVLIQPLEYIEGGLSEVEERVFVELACLAGARDVVVWVGAELTDTQVIEKFIELAQQRRFRITQKLT